jgi:hypothetical protein
MAKKIITENNNENVPLRQPVLSEPTTPPIHHTTVVSSVMPEHSVQHVPPVPHVPSEQIKQDLEKAISLNTRDCAPQEINNGALTEGQAHNIATHLGKANGLDTHLAYIAIFLLILKGAANSGTPESLEITILDHERNPVTIKKYDLMYSYYSITGNKFIRRLAEQLAIPIGMYAEKNGLSGDICEKINNKTMRNMDPTLRYPLTLKERAWASSFSQKIPGLEKLASERLPLLLALDYGERFTDVKRRRPPVKREDPKPRNITPKEGQSRRTSSYQQRLPLFQQRNKGEK